MKHNLELHNIVDLTEEDRHSLLEMLWNKSSNLGQSNLMKFDINIAKQEIITNNGYVYSICGRYIDLNLYIGSIVNSYNYDKINGRGSFGLILEALRENKNNKLTGIIESKLDNTHIE